VTTLVADVRHALRVLAKSPAFTAVAVLALGIGIGANTAIFSVIDRVLLRPLPYPDSERIVRVQRQFPGGSGPSTSIPKFMWWSRAKAFQSIAAYDFGGVSLNLGAASSPDPVTAVHVSRGFFEVFGVTPVVGRTFAPNEDLPGAGKFAVLTHSLWMRRFAGDPAIAAKPVLLNSEPYVVTGVLPPSFVADPPADLYLPLQADPNSANQGHYLYVAARLRRDTTLEAARAELKVIAEQVRAVYPDAMDKTETAGAIPLREAIGGEVRLPLLILGGAVAFVLLMACANVANLLLARSTGRLREVAIRTAIGASRGRVVRQLLTESLVLAASGGVAGLAIGAIGVRVLLAASPGNIPRINSPDHAAAAVTLVDWRVGLFLLAVTLLTGILFGLAPAIQVSRQEVNSFLKESGGRTGSGARHHRLRSLLVAGETALAVVLLVGAALMIRTFHGLSNVHPGFEAAGVLTAKTSLAGVRYQSTAQVDLMIRQVVERLEALPGVEAASAAVILPIEGGIDLPFTIEGQTPPGGGRWNASEQWRFVSPRYFDALRIPLRRGRVFDRRDTGGSPLVCVINEAFARKHWPKGDPIGARIVIGKGIGPEFEEPPREIVGIVGSVHEVGLSQGAQPVMYVPASQVTDGLMKLARTVIPLSWIIRARGEPMSLRPAVEREFLGVDSQLTPSRFLAMRQVMENSNARTNFATLLLTVFAAVALVLAAIGIYGVTAYAVEQRTREIGVRMALGAAPARVLGMVLRQGILLTGAGIAIGLAGAYALTRLLSRMLFGVEARDPLAFGAVVAILAMVSLAAVLIPARRATRVDPVHALRME
jgi:putative ABC transport system permease protein